MSPMPREVLAELIGNGALDFKAAAGEVGCLAWPWPAWFRFSKPYAFKS